MKPLSVYVHIPFCTIKCGYCDFNAYAGMDALKGHYQAALLAEIAAYQETLAACEIASIGFGGGTPGEFPAEGIAAVIRAIGEQGTLATGAEVTLEANPGTSTLAYLAALRDAGVNRISLGAQSFDPVHLGFLDRIHSVEAIGASVRAARAVGFHSLNLDLIYGLPGQTLDHWRGQLQRALDLRPDHLSLYALTVEEGTPLHRRVESGAVIMPDGDLVADMYEQAAEVLAAAGFRHYELSNWALPGHESRHNLAYWTDRDYLGIGAGAHGYLDRARYENIAHPRNYISASLHPAESATTTNPASSPSPGQRERGPGAEGLALYHHGSPETTIADWVALRLRLVDGFAPAEFRARFGIDIDAALGEPLRAAANAGWLEWDAGAIRLSPPGRLLHAELAVRLIGHLDRNPLVLPSVQRR